jgi:hypothetical protein
MSVGQPRVENGQRLELNQVSRTSGSWVSSDDWQLWQAVGVSRATTTGARCTNPEYSPSN